LDNWQKVGGFAFSAQKVSPKQAETSRSCDLGGQLVMRSALAAICSQRVLDNSGVDPEEQKEYM
jgi:hypothetical protein